MLRFIKSLAPVVACLAVVLGTAGRAAAQPAPGLTEMRVIGVASPQFAGGRVWDSPIAPGAAATPGNHGGGWIRVAVFERGYANSQVATFNGTRMQLYQSDPVVGADRKVYGWIRYYYLATPSTGGWFGNSARSIAAPWGTRSTGISIR